MNLPTDFITTIKPLMGEEADPFLAALEGEATVSIRLNPLKAGGKTGVAMPSLAVPWSHHGYYLEERPAFTFDPLLHAGCYYVQEASSMFVEHVVRELVEEPTLCLDLCAAPGGKSLSLLAALPEGSLLVSNELVRTRAHVLSETIAKSGNPNVVVTNNEARDLGRWSRFFDLILVDAPCSGEGMFRKEAVAIDEWSPENVSICARRQQDIVADVWPSLKPGGLLIYSTCTYNVSENEEVMLELARSTGAAFVEVGTGDEWGISPARDERAKGYRFFPHKTKGEGLALFILRKPEDGEPAEVSLPNGAQKGNRKKSDKKNSPFLWDVSLYESWLERPETFRFIERGDRVIALPERHSERMLHLEKQLKVLSMGVEVGIVKGKDIIPSHSLALSAYLRPDAFHRYSLSYAEAIAYLRKEALRLDEAPKGFLLVTYEGVPLGFVKNLGNRANNLYPAEWRVRSGYVPNTAPRVVSLHP